jgi:hypothetical protein
VTRQQISETLGVHINRIHAAFEAAIKEHPELDLYDSKKYNQKGFGIDYTLEEIFLAMSYYHEGKGLSELEKAMITDEFSMRPKEKVKAIGIDGTEEFLERVKRYPKLHCCATCAYCTKSSMRNKKPTMKPYCKLWERFLHRINADPYRDYCKQWEYSGKEPLIFYTADSPSNVDIYGNVKNEVMGFDVSNFGKSDSKEVRLVTEIGLDEDYL